MNVIMNPKNILTVIGILLALHGIMWVFLFDIGETMPNLSEQGLMAVGTLTIIVGAFNFPMATILLFCRNIEINSAKKLLTGTGVGFLFIVALTIRNGIIMASELGPMTPPLPVIIIWVVLSAWLLYAGLKKDSTESD